MVSMKSKITQKILSFLFLNEKESFYANELARLIGGDFSNTRKKLAELKEEGVLVDEFKGQERYFSLNKKYPLLKEYKQIVLKKFGLEKALKESLETLAGVKESYIFGSYAKNKLDMESDIDLLVVGDFDPLELQRRLVRVEKSIGREINSVEMSEEKFKKEKKAKDGVVRDIFSGKYIRIV